MYSIEGTIISIRNIYQKILMILFFSFIIQTNSSDVHTDANANRNMYQKIFTVLFCLTMIPIGPYYTCSAAETNDPVEIPKKLYATRADLLDNNVFTLSSYDENDPEAKVRRIKFGKRLKNVTYCDYGEWDSG